ncbi:MAG: hypothetical protein ABSF25_23500 [Bryobacteraceae bacterium]|jgi:hypothetical protein
MSPIPINLATEDELSEATLLRILRDLDRYVVGTPYRRGGFGYLRRTIHGWNSAARSIPFIVLTDLDVCECPASLIADWLTAPQHPNLLFRIAVREVESWLLADTVNLSRFLGVPEREMPSDCDNLADPKAEIIELARRSRIRAIRDGIVPKRGSTAKQGPDYNGLLGLFVRGGWDLKAAAAGSPSLARTICRLTVFNPAWTLP